jgi:hypothetical protein
MMKFQQQCRRLLAKVFSRDAGIIVVNDSKTVLHHASLAVAGMPDSEMDPVPPNDYFGQAMPTGKRVPFRLRFDAEGHHYEFPAEARALPFGWWNVVVHVDERMQTSVKVNGPF